MGQTPRFDFGRNWQSYSRTIDEEAVEQAQNGLCRMFGDRECLRDKTFIDIGCGSGVHSLAAMRLGANVTAIDVDPVSVATSAALLVDTKAEIREMSVFDASPDDLGQFDIVYSWGVLHHTGDVWGAIEHAAALVAPGGMLALALYEKTRLCRFWAWEKRLYAKAGPIVRTVVRAVFGSVLLIRLSLTRRETPWTALRRYRSDRGMSFWHDADDWLGGYPYQSVSIRDVIAFCEARDLWPVRLRATCGGFGLFGAGCSEVLLKQMRQSVCPDTQHGAGAT